MIRSMTGYARADTATPAGALSWEIRSVNHRYLDIQIRLPEDFRTLESDLRQRATELLGRGKVEANLRFSPETSANPITVDDDRIKKLVDKSQEIARAIEPSAAIDPLRILAWPGVIIDQKHDYSGLHQRIVDLYDEALEEFERARSREGARLVAVFDEACATLLELVAQVRQRLPEVRTAWLDRLKLKCAELKVDVDPNRLEQELAIMAQRSDVDEEMQRLASHVEELTLTLKRTDPIGRRLDFLMQELNREANTLSSKSLDAEMTRCAVDMKVLIEQMREQVQNIA